MTTTTTPLVDLPPESVVLVLMRDHRHSCTCDAMGHALMRWQPGDGTYRPADYTTPPYQPGRTTA